MRWAPALLALAAAGLAPPAFADAADPASRTPIRHVVSLMQENHSFDNYFGTYPGADGIPPGTCMPVDPTVRGGRCIAPFHIGNRAVEDLNHSARVHAAQYNGGRMNGFLSAIAQERGRVQPLVMGHYDARDLPFYWNVADQYVLFDRFFTSAAGGSVTNHMYWVTGGPGNERGDFIPHGGFDAPTIFDRLERAGVSWKFYVQNYDPGITFRSRALGDRGSQVVWVPLLNYARFVDDPALFAHIVPMERFYEDLQRGDLPAVAYLVPSGSSEHPPGSIKAGETFVRTLINAIMRSRYWTSSAFIWTYDDWGGWYDHVRPPRVDRFGYGFRAPALLVSAYARRGHVEHATMDFTSILKFIEENWGLEPLARRDRRATSIARAFDFSQRPRKALFLSRDRHVTRPPEPRRAAVYIAYAGALGLTLVVIALAIGWDRHARRRAVGAPLLLVVALAAALPSQAQAAGRLRPVDLWVEPALAGVKVRQDGRSYTTNRYGHVTMRVRRLPGSRRSPEGFRFARPRVLPKRLGRGVVARPGRFFLSASPARLRLGLSIFYEVRPEFIDVRGVPVDAERIRRVVYRNTLGERAVGTRDEPLELKGNWVSRSGPRASLRSKPLRYSVDLVDVDGSNVVNRAQVRFYPETTRIVPIKLLFFDVTIASRDALLGMHRGSAVEVRYPDGRTVRRGLDGDGRVRLARLARGDYRIRVDAAGLGTTRLVSLSRDQSIDVAVFSYVDVALACILLASAAGALLLVGRPALRRRVRARLARHLAHEGSPSDG